ncbi:calcium-binding protein [Roseovarius autotrophicus]|uniref:calcium-binding protein n=1 Tax=Roseovarius autotrophicus TaxID=2824121 RepID=UPI001B39ADFB|nr:calcium-binding protein [Roseovarius autotrophicus]
MLLFASLLGLVAVSASALVGFDNETDSDETEAEPPATPHEQSEGPDLLNALLAPAQVAAAAEPGAGIGVEPALVEAGWQIVEGGTGMDAISGTDAPEMILGRDGDDLIDAGGGPDEVRSGAGDDLIRGGAGPDTLHGGDGRDVLDGGPGDDRLFGHNGNDTLFGGEGNDSLVGSAGNDMLFGGDGDDALHGALDDDWLHGGMGSDTLFGGHGNDTLIGIVDNPATARLDDLDDGRDFLNGGAGDDVILAGRSDIVTTGSGADRVVLGDWLDAAHQVEILDFSAEHDLLMVVYDKTGPEPDIALAPDAEAASDMRLLLNGVEIARIANAEGLTLDHVALVSQSELLALARL